MTVTIDQLLAAAVHHGEASDPDHEVGDLRELVRFLWDFLTPAQQEEVGDHWVVRNLLAWLEEGGA